MVVPVRNDADELASLLEALGRQSVRPDGVIVVDNGSTDTSAEVARAAGCVVVTHPPPDIAGAAAAGYGAARNAIIVRCDADTRPPPHWLEAHLRCHSTAKPGTVIVTGPALFALPPPLGLLTARLYLGGYFVLTGAALGHCPFLRHHHVDAQGLLG